MSECRQLLDLQQVDREISEKEQTLVQVEAQLNDNEKLETSRRALAEEQQKLAELEKAQKSLEWEVGDLAQKVKQQESQLFAGKTSNPKELIAMQKELDSLQSRRKASDDKLLQTMEELESAQITVKTASSSVAELEKEWQVQKEQLVRQRDELNSAIAALKKQRQEVAGLISRTTLEMYETVKSSRGQAVARVERGMCQGCRLILPTGTWQRVRSGALVQCSSCGRILCPG
ncbi:MAG: hypothetical protein HYX87_07760 [Chloroflexi bacterium]|nr:hypothetical protein [Chloroflexota bacterium]